VECFYLSKHQAFLDYPDQAVDSQILGAFKIIVNPFMVFIFIRERVNIASKREKLFQREISHKYHKKATLLKFVVKFLKPLSGF